MTGPRNIQHAHDDGWVNSDPDKIDPSLERGLADSAAGRVSDGGDFTQYIDAEGRVDDPTDDVIQVVSPPRPAPRRR